MRLIQKWQTVLECYEQCVSLSGSWQKALLFWQMSALGVVTTHFWSYLFDLLRILRSIIQWLLVEESHPPLCVVTWSFPANTVCSHGTAHSKVHLRNRLPFHFALSVSNNDIQQHFDNHNDTKSLSIIMIIIMDLQGHAMTMVLSKTNDKYYYNNNYTFTFIS